MGKEKLIFGFGVSDAQRGECTRRNKAFTTWYGMIRRCYDEKYHEERPSYTGCKVSEKWRRFSEYKKWFLEHYSDGCELDKDLIEPEKREYSPETCSFLPREINIFLANKRKINKALPEGVCWHKRDKCYYTRVSICGKIKSLGYYENLSDARKAYKSAREEHAKALADKYKDKLDKRAYDALMNYKENDYES